MPLPDGLRQEDVQTAYPTTVAEVICADKTGHLRGGHWSSWPVRTTADYFVSCCCGCQEMYVVSGFEKHAGRSSHRKWKASTRVRGDGEELPLGDWIIHECNLRKADLPTVGQTLQVYWPLDRAWYSGRVLSYTEAEGATQVVYDDGDVEMLHMVMERYKVSPAAETSRALQIMPNPSNIVDLSLIPDDVIDLSLSGDLDAICLHPMPQLTNAAANLPDLAVASQLVIKKEPDQPMPAAKPTIQAQVQVHADNQSPGLASKAQVQSPMSVSKPCTKQLIRDALVTKPPTKASAVQPDCAGPSAAAPATVRSNTLKTTVAKHIRQGSSQVALGTTQASPAQKAAKLPRNQHNSSQTSRPKPALDEGHGSRSHKGLHGRTSGKGLKSVLKPSKRSTLHQLQPNGLRPLPDRPAKVLQRAQQAQHAQQTQHAQQLKRACLDHALPQMLNSADLQQIPQNASLAQEPQSASIAQLPQRASLGQKSQSTSLGQMQHIAGQGSQGARLEHRTRAVMHGEGLTAGPTAQPSAKNQDRHICGGAQHKAKRIKLEPDTQEQQHQQQEVAQHEASPSAASAHAMHPPESDAAAQTAIVVADRLPPHLLQQFGVGVNFDAAQKQAALEELVLAVADAGVTARFFANLDKHDRAEAEQNLSRYYRSISVLVQSTHGQVQVADVIRTYIDSLCQA